MVAIADAAEPVRPASARGLTKPHANVPAIRGIDLETRRGEIFALPGPNGAGKTSGTGEGSRGLVGAPGQQLLGARPITTPGRRGALRLAQRTSTRRRSRSVHKPGLRNAACSSAAC